MPAPRAVVVGTGFGCRVHVPALQAAGFDVVALVGRDLDKTQRRAERANVAHACASLTEALELGGIDAVTVASPPDMHHDHVIEAIGAGAHVVCEKPFALDSLQADAMYRAASASGRAHLVGHEFRWAPDRATLGRAIASGAIGEVRLVTLVQHVVLAASVETPAPEWWFDPVRGGGWLGASGSHVIDQVRVWLDDEFSSVSARLPMVSARDATVHAADSFSVRASMRRGAEVVLQQTAAAWGMPTGVSCVAGTRGTLWLDGAGVRLADADGVRTLDVPDDVRIDAAELSDDPRHRFTHLELGPYTRLCSVLRRAVAGEPWQQITAEVPLPTFADGLAEMQVIDAIRASAAADGDRVDVVF